ncbi:MAG: TMEM165/GDT1 family protein [Rhodocyclaceae bacterium]|jgi:putative Ca2+/H+ antiporter (TMEM165/GDT1 family)|nr:TMEM165/GDT1 family protein [Rhodocyclaceae bacterium]
METFLIATGVVALAEIGDKTQLLSLVLAARYRAPWAISAGIFVATLLNHALAALVGESVFEWLGPDWMRWIIGLSFIAMAIWTLIPDRLDEDEENAAEQKLRRYGVFVMTMVVFFLLEMGDKTQVATAILAARFNELFSVVMGTTVGMLVANVPLVFFGNLLLRKIQIELVHRVTAVLFLLLGLATLAGVSI